MPLRLAVLLSGNGSTLQNILDHIDGGHLDATVEVVLSSREGVFGLERAQQRDIPAVAVPRKQYDDAEAFNTALWEALAPHEFDLVVLAGFMSLIHVPDQYKNKMINVHPALIPAFSGKGMYGHHVHQAVLDYGCKITGATVHIVDEHYDHGPIILQEAVPVFDSDTADTLAERVQAKERELYPRAIQLFAGNRIRVEGRHVRIE
jgi:formyltetrahydrofolate-dependent phosphoribosylglycinamide formyltransferase